MHITTKRGLSTAAICALAFVASACHSAGETTETVSDGTLAFAEKYIAAQKAVWEDDDFDALESLEHPRVVFQNINGTVFDGREAHFTAIKAMKEQFGNPAIRQTWRVLMAGDGLFSLGYRWTLATTPRETLIDGMLVGKVENGQLVEEWGANYVVADPAG